MATRGVPACVAVEASGSDGAVLIVRVSGELDMASRDAIEPAVMAAVATAESVIVDLSELTFCDSTGVAMFLAVREKAMAEETRLVLRGIVGPVRRVFEITGIHKLFDLLE